MTIPVLGVTAYGPTPTDSCDAQGQNCAHPTMDVAMQYDALGGDFPIYPLHLPAVANSLMSYVLLHGAVPEQHLDDAVPQGTYGDTTYYMLPTDLVPLLLPFDGLVPRPILVAADEPLRVLIEAGYRRDISPGQPTPAYLIPVINPVTLTVNLLRSVPVGLDNAAAELVGDRPLGTTDPGLYGVGGDDADLKGLPAGIVPLGSTSPTPTTMPAAAPSDTAPVAAAPPPPAGTPALQQDSKRKPTPKPVIRRSGPSTPLLRVPQRSDERKAKWRPPIIDASTGSGPRKDDAGPAGTNTEETPETGTGTGTGTATGTDGDT